MTYATKFFATGTALIAAFAVSCSLSPVPYFDPGEDTGGEDTGGDDTDPGDDEQLTDGKYTAGYFWTQKTTVGWSSTLVGIDLDLSQVLPIRGLSYSTAAGVADVGWPESISVLVSDDGKAYYFAGDLVALAEGGRPAADGGYRTFTFRTQALQTKGRYVRLAICPSGGNYLFCDEIEVYTAAP